MGRVKLCFGILIAIIVFGIGGILIIEHKTTDIIKLVDKTQYYSDMGNTEKALEAVDELEKQWIKYHKLASVIVSNDKISDVQNSVSRIQPLIESQVDELNAEIANARSSLMWIIESEIPRFTNIF